MPETVVNLTAANPVIRRLYVCTLAILIFCDIVVSVGDNYPIIILNQCEIVQN
jgi:hypothetical protein